MSKYENYTIESRKRSEIQNAPYNPRTITESAFKKLKAKIKDKRFGLLQPLIINNVTGNMVGGHQRLSVLDDLHKGEDYDLTVAVVELSEKDEVEANIFLNNQSAMGQWDNDLLSGLQEQWNFNLEVDLGFDKLDIDMMFADVGGLSKTMEQIEVDKFIEEDNEEVKARKAHTKEVRAKINETNKAKDENASGWYDMKDDYYITVAFNSTKEKLAFMDKAGLKQDRKFIKIEEFLQAVK